MYEAKVWATAPRCTGNTSAITQIALVNNSCRPAGGAAMNRSAAYPAAMAANQDPGPRARHGAGGRLTLGAPSGGLDPLRLSPRLRPCRAARTRA
jgi:hypothetical protein